MSRGLTAHGAILLGHDRRLPVIGLGLHQPTIVGPCDGERAGYNPGRRQADVVGFAVVVDWQARIRIAQLPCTCTHSI